MTPDQMLRQFKKWKVPYRELDGWRTHNRDRATGLTFGPVHGGMFHHTGDDAPDAADRKVIWEGRAGLPGPLAQWGINDNGIVDIHSAGRANHAGGGDPRVLQQVINESYKDYPSPSRYHTGSSGATDGNDHFYGWETYYSGSKRPTDAAYRSAVLLGVVLCDFYSWSPKSIIGHKEWSDWKSDPGHVDMRVYRLDVAEMLRKGPDTPIDPQPPTEISLARLDLARARVRLRKAAQNGRTVAGPAARAVTDLLKNLPQR